MIWLEYVATALRFPSVSGDTRIGHAHVATGQSNRAKSLLHEPGLPAVHRLGVEILRGGWGGVPGHRAADSEMGEAMVGMAEAERGQNHIRPDAAYGPDLPGRTASHPVDTGGQ